MEEESFEDDDVAAVLNANFICVKVDREEQPDVDAVYMEVCQTLTGSGGWPLTLFLTADKKPFFAGTYFPNKRRYGQPGLLELLSAVQEKWQSDRESLTASGEEIARMMVQPEEVLPTGEELNRKPIENALNYFLKSFDNRYGGFGTPPKFPSPHQLIFLLRCHNLGIQEKSLEMAERTLGGIIHGGLFDHIGGGFSRYSTDAKWLAPHFEKMLYDNALLTIALLECYQITGNNLYRYAAEQTLGYVEREMTSPEGGFYSAQDADSEGEEGKYYTFSPDEAVQALGDEDSRIFCDWYDVTPDGNFEGKSIPNRIGKEDVIPDTHMRGIIKRMRDFRAGRYRLGKDDKILTSWNALMIVAFAKAYRALGKRVYLDRAARAYSFLKNNLTDMRGRLLISFRNGKAKGLGLLDDYAFLAWACLELYESSFNVEYLERACMLIDTVLSQFSGDSGGFYLSGNDAEALLFRPKEQYDGAIPSGNSAAALCLVRIAALTGEAKWREASRDQLLFYEGMFRRQPTACTFALTALMLKVYPSRELICIVSDDKEKERLALELGRFYMPHTAILVKSERDSEKLAAIAPFTRAYVLPPGRAFAFYLCENQSCSTPVYSIEEIISILSSHNIVKRIPL